MIFLGDIACPEEKIQSFVDSVDRINVFNNEIVIFNLEVNILEPKRSNVLLLFLIHHKLFEPLVKLKK